MFNSNMFQICTETKTATPHKGVADVEELPSREQLLHKVAALSTEVNSIQAQLHRQVKACLL
jgi:hypothetical protein